MAQYDKIAILCELDACKKEITRLRTGLEDVLIVVRKCQVEYPPTTFVHDQLEAIAVKTEEVLRVTL